MTYGLEVYNSRGSVVLNSTDVPFVFTEMGKKFSFSPSSGGWYTAYCDFSASPRAMVTMEWPEVEAGRQQTAGMDQDSRLQAWEVITIGPY